MSPRKRSVRISGHTTSISMEEPFWTLLSRYAEERNLSINALVAEIDAARISSDGIDSNLSSAVRVWVLEETAKRAGLT